MHLSLKGSLIRSPMLNRVGQRLLQLFEGASAAYSLRDLASNIASVVRVRRASDNSEKDFSAADVSSGAMTQWVNAQIVPPLDVRELVDGERTGDLVEAAAAYSLRNLSSTYTGNVVDVRRSSDDTEESFTAAEVADGTLVTWVGASNDGHVKTWYDQSGNDNHATQGTDAKQPKIVDAGSLVTGGIDFDGVNDGLSVSGQVLTSSLFYATSVMNHATGTSTANGQNAFGQYQIGTSGRFQLSANASNEYSFFANATDPIIGFSTGAIGTAQTLISINGDGSNAEIWRDGTSKATDAYSGFTPANVNFTIGIDASGDREFNGNIAEVIIYNSDQSDNRTAIEANIGDHYGIDLPSGVDTGYDQVDGFVETWYDQSGNGNDAVQQVSGRQPKIVDAGVLVSGGLDFDGVDDLLNLSNIVTGTIGVSSFIVGNADTTSISEAMLSQGSTSGTFGSAYSITSEIAFRCAGNTTYDDDFIDASKLLLSIHHAPNSDSSDVKAYLDGSELGQTSTTSTPLDYTNQDATIGGNFGSTKRYDGSLAEIIVYASDQSDNRVAIETNINNQYDIY